MKKEQPIFISFYTNNGIYPEKKKILEKSLNKFKLQYEIVEVTIYFESWLEAVF